MAQNPTGDDNKAGNPFIDITIDDANINLGAATRALAPGGSMWLYYNATKWNELSFTAGADNS